MWNGIERLLRDGKERAGARRMGMVAVEGWTSGGKDISCRGAQSDEAREGTQAVPLWGLQGR